MALVLAWELLHFVEDGGFAAKGLMRTPVDEPALPIPSLKVGWRQRAEASRLTVGELAKLSEQAAAPVKRRTSLHGELREGKQTAVASRHDESPLGPCPRGAWQTYS